MTTLLLKLKTFLFDFDLTRYYYDLKNLAILILGILPSIYAFLGKYGLEFDHFVFGVAGQGTIYLFKQMKNRSKGKKSPIDFILVVTHLCLGGFFSLILTAGIIQSVNIVGMHYVVWISSGIGMFYEMILNTIVDLASDGAKIFKVRAKKAFNVFFNLSTDDVKEKDDKPE